MDKIVAGIVAKLYGDDEAEQEVTLTAEQEVTLTAEQIERLRRHIEVLTTESYLPTYDDYSAGYASGYESGRDAAADMLLDILPFLRD